MKHHRTLPALLISGISTGVITKAHAVEAPEVKNNLITVHNVDCSAENDSSVYHYDQTVPLAKLKQGSHINQRANAADKASHFSRLIRVGLLRMEP